jgi:hypothetical protein
MPLTGAKSKPRPLGGAVYIKRLQIFSHHSFGVIQKKALEFSNSKRLRFVPSENPSQKTYDGYRNGFEGILQPRYLESRYGVFLFGV